MTDKIMHETILDGGFYELKEYNDDGKTWYIAINSKKEYNIANSYRRILCDKPFACYHTYQGKLFNNGWAIIEEMDGYINFVNENGDRLLKNKQIRVKSTAMFVDNVVRVVLENGKQNFLTTEGEFILPIENDYSSVLIFKNGFGLVCKDGEYNFVDKSGKLISEIWFENAYPFNEYGLARCYIKGKGWNVINTEGKLVLKANKLFVTKFGNLIITTQGEHLEVYRGDGTLMSVNYYDYRYLHIDKENSCVFLRKIDTSESINVFLRSGEKVFEFSYEEICPIRITAKGLDRELFFLVKKRNSKGSLVCTIMDKNGKYAFTKKWFQQFDGEFKFEQEYTDYVTVMYNGKWYKLNFDEKNSLIPIKKGYAKEDAYLYLIGD